jgi:type VI secretion system protein ImpA
MSEELQKPPVVDLDVLLQPISDENPSGESLRYSGIYDEITEARRADDTLNRGDWQEELKVADYRRVIDLAVPALSNESKDLQVAAWLSESLVREYGFLGLRDGLRLMTGFQENFWDTLHPEVDEGDMEGRANAISWMDTQTTFVLKQVPITAGGYSFNDWEDSKRFDFPDNIESMDSDSQERWAELRAQAENERRVTAEMWRKARTQTRRRFCEELNYAIEECFAAFADLNRVIEEKYDRKQMPGLSSMKKSLDDVHLQVKKLLEEKRIEEPDTVEDDGSEESAGEGGFGVSSGSGSAASSGAVQNRKDALRRLAEIAAFFQKTEPHSPVAYLVQRAVKWGNMPLEGWLRDVIHDENVLYSLRQTLGLDTEGGGGYSSNGDSSYSEPATEESSSEGW